MVVRRRMRRMVGVAVVGEGVEEGEVVSVGLGVVGKGAVRGWRVEDGVRSAGVGRREGVVDAE